MSDTPKIKLNLKALNTEPKEDSKPTTQDTPSVSSIVWETNAVSNIQKNPVTGVSKATDTQKVDDSQKSHNISFADLTKQINDKNTPLKEEIADPVKIKTSLEDTSTSNTTPEVKVNDTELIKDNKDITSNLVEKWDSAEKDKVALENASKTQSILKEEEEKSKKKEKKSLFSKFKRKKTKNIEKKKWEKADLTTIDNWNIKENEQNIEAKTKKEKIHFLNYESHFKKESTNFLKRFQNFKYAPSTRFGMVLGMIGITILIIGGLMVFFPEKHSLDIYKASLIELSSQQDTETPWPQEVIILEDIDNKDAQTIPDNVPTQDITTEDESKEKLRQHLINKYK